MQLVYSLEYNSVLYFCYISVLETGTRWTNTLYTLLCTKSFYSNVKNQTGILSCTFVYADHLQKLYTFVWYLHVYDPDS